MANTGVLVIISQLDDFRFLTVFILKVIRLSACILYGGPSGSEVARVSPTLNVVFFAFNRRNSIGRITFSCKRTVVILMAALIIVAMLRALINRDSREI